MPDYARHPARVLLAAYTLYDLVAYSSCLASFEQYFSMYVRWDHAARFCGKLPFHFSTLSITINGVCLDKSPLLYAAP